MGGARQRRPHHAMAVDIDAARIEARVGPEDFGLQVDVADCCHAAVGPARLGKLSLIPQTESSTGLGMTDACCS